MIRKMNRVLMWSATAAVLVLAWLALDDITTGSQPTFRLEWAMVGLAVVWMLVLGFVTMRRRRSS
jgi:hypothetical protein